MGKQRKERDRDQTGGNRAGGVAEPLNSAGPGSELYVGLPR